MGKATGMEAWGEDLLMQRCMDLHGVDKVEAFDITTDSMCRAFRPKGEKSNARWRADGSCRIVGMAFEVTKEASGCHKANRLSCCASLFFLLLMDLSQFWVLHVSGLISPLGAWNK